MKRIVPVALAALVFLALVAVYMLHVFGPVYEVSRATAVRHDDFFYSVTGVARRPLAAGRDRYAVDVLVDNRARRVGYVWHDDIAYVRDGRGPRYAPRSRGTFTLAAGSQRTARLEFDLPESVRHPLLRFWDGVYMGDIFNAVSYAKAGIPLSASAPRK